MKIKRLEARLSEVSASEADRDRRAGRVVKFFEKERSQREKFVVLSHRLGIVEHASGTLETKPLLVASASPNYFGYGDYAAVLLAHYATKSPSEVDFCEIRFVATDIQKDVGYVTLESFTTYSGYDLEPSDHAVFYHQLKEAGEFKNQRQFHRQMMGVAELAGIEATELV
jgi:hypothetical protein